MHPTANVTPSPQQLDIFAHSRDVMLRNDVLEALERRDAAGARAAWRALAAEFEADAALSPMNVLVDALEQRRDSPLADLAAVAAERRALEESLAPAARRVLGAHAAEPWLRPCWATLAARSHHLPFDGAHAEEHAAALWLCAKDWRAVAQATEHIESWRRIPAPLAWMAEARCRESGLDTLWPLLAELAWLSPARASALCTRLGDPLLARLHERFEADFDPTSAATDMAWFPAWLLTQTPALAPHLSQAQRCQHSPPEQGMRLVVELLGLERQGRHHDLVQRRRALRDLNAALYTAYMATR